MDGTITIGAKIETKQFDKQIEDMERKIADLENQLKLKGTGVLDEKQIHDVEVELEKSKNQLAGLYQQKAKLDASGNGRGFGNLADGLRDAVKHAGRLVLSVFGIRSAYLALRRASSDLASYDAQYGANLEYIRYALTQLIAPVLIWIVNLAKTVLMYINYIANALFGVNLFSRASADNFNKMKKGIGGANSEAKKLQKTLTGFDEMNILNSSSTGGGGGVGGGAFAPDFDLSDISGFEMPEGFKKFVDFIKDNKDTIIKALEEIAGILGVIGALKITGVLTGISAGFKILASEAGLLSKVLAGIGLALIFTGIAIAVQGVIDLINDPSWENARKVFLGLSMAIAGLGTVMIALNATNPLGWVLLVVGAVSSLITYVKMLTSEEESHIEKIDAVKASTDALKSSRERLEEVTNKYVNAVDKAEEAEKALKKAEDEAGITVDELLRKMKEENLTYKDLDSSQRKVYKAYLNNKTAQEELEAQTQLLTAQTKSYNEQTLMLVASIKETTNSTEEYKNKLIDLYNKGKISAEQTADALSVALADMDEDTRKTFVENIPNEIKNSLNPNLYQAKANEFRNWWNGSVMDTLKKQIDIKIGTSWSGDVAKKLIGFKTGGFVTKLASGGLVNMPNKGVPVASAIAGESGREGIIPLTDSGAMQELGKEIGRWITINASITNNMNGRVISRELRSIQNDQNFAYNI